VSGLPAATVAELPGILNTLTGNVDTRRLRHAHGLVAEPRRAGRMGQGKPMTGDYEPSALGFVREHVEQIVRVEHDNRYAAVASNGAQPTNPQWYPSLLAEPVIELQDGAVTRQYRAREVFGDEKVLWWRPGGGRVSGLCRLPAQDRPPDPGLRSRTGQRGHTGR
jgi:hypothetical protein